MKHFLVGIGALTAMSVGLFQGPQVDSAEQVLAMSVKGAANCSYDGYVTSICSIHPHCTAGDTEGALYVGGNAGSHKKIAGTHSDGNCTGDARCPAALPTSRLSTDGCGGGG